MCVQVLEPTVRIDDFDDVSCGGQDRGRNLLPELRDQCELDSVTSSVTLFSRLCSVWQRVHSVRELSLGSAAGHSQAAA